MTIGKKKHEYLAVSLFLLLCHPLSGETFFESSLKRAQDDRESNLSEQRALVVAVPGNLPWTDTGMDVTVGQKIVFKATGKISLQKGNPQAECGPEGYDLRTVRQPLPEKNLGALIGKVVISISVFVDEKTGEEKKEEVAQVFFVGLENQVEMPAKGRLFLGINENVSGDNAGEFQVTIITASEEDRQGLFRLVVFLEKSFHELGIVLAVDEIRVG
jgi:hypothetical protein